MIFKQIELPEHYLCYIIVCEESDEAVVVDVAFESKNIKKFLRDNDYKLRYIVNTGFDKEIFSMNTVLKQSFPDAETVMNINTDKKVDLQIDDRAEFEVGDVVLKFFYMPGHTKESMCVLVNDKKLLTGNTLLVGKVGDLNQNTSDSQSMYSSLQLIKKEFKPEIEVWPGLRTNKEGHSNVGQEKASNPFLLAKDYGRFVWLHKNWLEYISNH